MRWFAERPIEDDLPWGIVAGEGDEEYNAHTETYNEKETSRPRAQVTFPLSAQIPRRNRHPHRQEAEKEGRGDAAG